MRASRLVQLLLLLQARGRTTAAVLAAELEVSERTVHRDVDALSAAGVPIYAERGPHGGIQLVDGYRTRLTGLTGDEAEALSLSGIPGPAAELGLGTVVAAARLKVLAALPAELRARASRLVERFHLDAAGWFRPGEVVPHLAPLADAVWNGRRVTVAYERGDREVERALDPLGLVLKGGVWYLVAVAIAAGEVRTYRVARVRRVTVIGDPVLRPPDFELAAYWNETTSAYERAAPQLTATIRIAPRAIGVLVDLVGERAVRGSERLGEDADGWRRLRLAIDWPDEVPARLAALGDAVEVLEPSELRARVRETARRSLARHAPLPAGGAASGEEADDGGHERDHEPPEQGDDGDGGGHHPADDEPVVARRGAR
jgi:predicted DNA-binding transcriptional regulator YafY